MTSGIISWIPSFKKRTIILGFLITGWIFIASLAATAFDILPYDKFRSLFPIILVTLPVWILLESKSIPCKMEKQEEQKWNMAMILTFVCFIIVFVTGILRLGGSI